MCQDQVGEIRFDFMEHTEMSFKSIPFGKHRFIPDELGSTGLVRSITILASTKQA